MSDPVLYENNAKEVFKDTIIGYDRLKFSIDFDK